MLDCYNLLGFIMHGFIYSSEASRAELLKERVLAGRIAAGYRVRLVEPWFAIMLLYRGR